MFGRLVVGEAMLRPIRLLFWGELFCGGKTVVAVLLESHVRAVLAVLHQGGHEALQCRMTVWAARRHTHKKSVRERELIANNRTIGSGQDIWTNNLSSRWTNTPLHRHQQSHTCIQATNTHTHQLKNSYTYLTCYNSHTVHT